MTVRRNLGTALSVLALALVACGPGPAASDGGADASAPGVPGTVAILPTSTEGPPTGIERLELRIAQIRLVGDRGPALDPRVEDVGLVTLGTDPYEISVGDVSPALYSAVVLDLAADGDGAALELLTTPEDGPTLDIVVAAPLTLDARCEHGAAVSTTGVVRIAVDLDLGDPVQAAAAGPLPAPDGSGVVHVDETTAPEALAAFRARLLEVVHAECDADAI